MKEQHIFLEICCAIYSIQLTQTITIAIQQKVQIMKSVSMTWMISSQLEQAVGRARLLREDCTVIVYAGFPVEQAEYRDKSLIQNAE